MELATFKQLNKTGLICIKNIIGVELKLGFETVTKKLSISVIIFVGLVCIWDAIIRPTWPEGLWDKVEDLTENRALMDSIGGKKDVELYYNNNFEKSDTFSYWIKIKGYEGELFYKSFQVRTHAKNWKQLSDTLVLFGDSGRIAR